MNKICDTTYLRKAGNRLAILSFLFFLLSAGNLYAQSATWNLTTSNTPVICGSVTATAPTPGASLTTVTSVLATGYSSFGWPTGNPAVNYSNTSTNYIQYTLTNTSAAAITISTVNVTTYNSAAAQMKFAIRYSFDNFATSTLLTNNNLVANGTVAFTGPAAATVNAGATIIFRVYGYRAASATTTRFGNTFFQLIAAPVAPTNFTATAISSTQINLGATANAAGDNILLAWNSVNTFGTPVTGTSYIPGNAIAGGGTVLYKGAAGNPFFNHTGLTPNTTYYYQVWSVNTGCLLYSSAVVNNATTPCSAIASFPFTENFDIASPTLSCWRTSESVSGAGVHWAITTTDATNGVAGPQAGSYFAFLDVFDAISAYNTYNLTSPVFTLDATPKQFKYYYYLGSGGYTNSPSPLTVQISVGGGAFTNIYAHTTVNSSFATSSAVGNWALNIIDLSAYASQSIQFRFASNSNFGTGFTDQGLDEVTIENKPTCLQPPALTASVVGLTTATISWTAPSPAPALGYDYYVTTSAVPPNGATVPTGSTLAGITTANLSGLTSMTTYYFWVRAKCSGIDISNWSGGSFQTLYCLPSSSTAGYYITNFQTFLGTTNISNLGTLLSANGYGNYVGVPGKILTALQGTTINFTVKFVAPLAPKTFGFAIFADWNSDGDFTDGGETVFISNAFVGPTFSSSFTIPVGAPAGTTRLRIAADYLSTAPTPCQTILAGEVEDYTITVNALPACSGTPTGGTSTATPTTGDPGSTFIANATGFSANSGLAFQWQSSPTGGAPWTDVPGATTVPANITAVGTSTTTWYRLRVTCISSAQASFSGSCTFITKLCVPSTVTPATYYTSRISFIGTLNDFTNASGANSFTSPGYSDYTSNPAFKSKQAQGQSIDIDILSSFRTLTRAWVDWNNNSVFESSELVYDATTVYATSTTFGFTIPAATVPGDYRIRIRTLNNEASFEDPDFQPCGSLSTGETEDYLFTVVASCSAYIKTVTDGVTCGPGTVNLSVTANGSPTSYHWYAAATGGSPIQTTLTPTWTTPSISSTTIYYVTADNGCESLVRTAITASVNGLPVLTLNPTIPIVCGEGAVQQLAVTGDTEIGYPINENFETGLGVFTVNNISILPASSIPFSQWQSESSTFVPGFTARWKPSISTGLDANKFAFSTADIINNTVVKTALESPVVSLVNYTNLTLSFDIYYSHYLADNVTSIVDSLLVEVSTNAGASYDTVAFYVGDQGYGTKFANKVINLNSYIGNANMKVRFLYDASWVDGVAIDNVKLYGSKPLTTSFSWAPTGGGNLFIDAAGTMPYSSGSVPNIYIKPTPAQIAAGADLNFTATATLSNGCSASLPVVVKIGPSQWTGTVSGDWHDKNNWCSKTVPTATTIVEIPSGTPFSPVITAVAFAKKLTVFGSALLTINSGGSIEVYDDFSNQGTLTNNGRISLKGSSGLVTQAFPGPGTITAMSILEINNTGLGVALNNSIFIDKELKPTAGNLKLGNFDITIRSGPAFTAAVSAVGASAGFNYAAGSGRFVVERYINTGQNPGQHAKGWQLLTAPTIGQKIWESWMEGAGPNLDPNPGYGTQITGVPGTAGGFDATAVAPAMKFYLPASDTWQEVGNPTTTQINNNQGYFIFIRGDRSVINFSGPTNYLPKPTRLRSRGTIQVGNVTSPLVTGGKFQSVANPYPSAIDYSTIDRTGGGGGVSSSFTLFDPTLLGSHNVGGYQNISSAALYSATPGSTLYDNSTSYQYIQSGMAFIADAVTSGTNGTLQFKEVNKNGTSILLSRDEARRHLSMLSTNLLYINGGTPILADGNRVVFDNNYRNRVDGDDAAKLTNEGENFGLTRNGVSLIVEARKKIRDADTIFYNMSKLRLGSYKLMFMPQNIAAAGLAAELVDQYLHTRLPVSLTDTSYADISITGDPASSAPGRFILVFKSPTVSLPVAFINISVSPDRDKGNRIDWKVTNELDIDEYSIERSADGHNFSELIKTAADKKTDYTANDGNPFAGDNFYRIKATDISGLVQYSKIVKTGLPVENTGITVYPNPISGKKIQLQFNNQATGTYQLQMVDKYGQVVYNGTAAISGNKFVKSITLNASISSGVYQMKITGINGKVDMRQIIVP